MEEESTSVHGNKYFVISLLTASILSALGWMPYMTDWNLRLLMPFGLLFFPGLFASMALSGNVHGGSPNVAFFINLILYWVPAYFLVRRVAGRMRSH